MNEKIIYFHCAYLARLHITPPLFVSEFFSSPLNVSATRIRVIFLLPERLQGLQNSFPLDLFILDHPLERHNIRVYIQKTKLQSFNGL